MPPLNFMYKLLSHMHNLAVQEVWDMVTDQFHLLEGVYLRMLCQVDS